MPTVSCGFGTRAKLIAVAVEDRNRPVLARALLFDDGLENLDRRAEGNDADDLAVAKHRHLDGHDQPLLDRADEQVGVLRASWSRTPSRTMSRLLRGGRLAVSAVDRGEQLPALAVGDQHDAVLAILLEKARGDAAEIVEIARCAARWSATAPEARRSFAASRRRARGECCARSRARAVSRPGGPVRSY